MEMLNFNMMLSAASMWGGLIGLFAKWLVNYGWTIVVFTICLKLVLSPLDIFQRKSSQKQSQFMAVMQPEMDKLQQKYGNDKQKLNEEQAKLYKKYNFNVGGMCLTMLITLVVTLVVFFTLFSGLREIGNEKLYTTYARVDDKYVEAQTYCATNEITGDDANTYILNAVDSEYNLVQDESSWLWVKNVWKSDTNTSQFVEKDDYVNYYIEHHDIAEGEVENVKAEVGNRYDVIVGHIQAEDGETNGYYVLIILAAVISFATQFLSAKLLQPKGQKFTTVNLVMFAVIPLSMVLFAMTSNVVFTLYIITNSVMSAIISTTISLIMKSKTKGKTPEQVIMSEKKVEVVEYSRNYRK